MSQRRSPRALVVCAVLLACLAPTSSFTATNAARAGGCAALRAWAQDFGRTPTLDEMARLDRSHRAALFTVIEPAVRASLWREHLSRFSRSPELSANQRALVEAGITLATPALYERTSAALEAHKRLTVAVKAAFPLPRHLRAWADLTLDGESAPLAAQGEAACQCRPESAFYECYGGSCSQGGCSWVLDACGLMDPLPCTGRCS